MEDLKAGGIAVIDFGSQYTQLIARRIRELGVYAAVHAHHSDASHINRHRPAGYLLSGGPSSVYEAGAPQLPALLLDVDRPSLGICYGMQLLTAAQGGAVAPASEREYGPAVIRHEPLSPLFDGLDTELLVWMSHGDRIESLPAGYRPLAASDNSPFAAIGDLERDRYGLQFHPEVRHSPAGQAILGSFGFCPPPSEADEATADLAAETSQDKFIKDETEVATCEGLEAEG